MVVTSIAVPEESVAALEDEAATLGRIPPPRTNYRLVLSTAAGLVAIAALPVSAPTVLSDRAP